MLCVLLLPFHLLTTLQEFNNSCTGGVETQLSGQVRYRCPLSPGAIAAIVFSSLFLAILAGLGIWRICVCYKASRHGATTAAGEFGANAEANAELEEGNMEVFPPGADPAPSAPPMEAVETIEVSLDTPDDFN